MNTPGMLGAQRDKTEGLCVPSGEDLKISTQTGNDLGALLPPLEKAWSSSENAAAIVKHELPDFKLGDLPPTALGYDRNGNAVGGYGE